MTQFVPGTHPDFDTDSDGRAVAFRDRGGQHHGLVTYQTSPGGGVVLLGPDGVVTTSVSPSTQEIAYIGDSRMRYGYQPWYSAAYGRTSTAGFRVDIMGAGPTVKASPTYGYGSIDWDAVNRKIRWTAPADTPGPWVDFGVGMKKLESGTPGSWLLAVWTSTDAGVNSGAMAVEIGVGDYRPKITSEGMPTHVSSALARRITPLKYFGAGGAHTRDCFQMLEWYNREAGGAGYDVIRVGTNDANARVRTVEESIAFAYAVFDARRAIGRRLVICGENARWERLGERVPMIAETRNYLLALNRAYRDYAAAHQDSCRFVDLWALSADPNHDDGTPIADLLKDNLHDSVKGAGVFAKAVVTALRELGAVNDPPPQPHETDMPEISWMRGVGGTAGNNTTGVVPDGILARGLVEGQLTATTEIIGYPDKQGRRLKVVATGVTGGVFSVQAAQTGGYPFSVIGAGVGDAVEVYCDFEVLTPGLLHAPEIMLYYFGGGQRTQIFTPVEVGRYRLKSPPRIIQANDTSFRPQIYVTIPAGVTVEFAVGDLLVRKVSAF